MYNKDMNVSHLLYYLKTYKKQSLLVVGGSTASGKTSCAIDIAQRLIAQGKKVEIISADSRQIYQGIPIFSGAVTKSEMSNIRHHLVGTEQIGVARSADWFRHESMQLIEQIHSRGATPIVVGGSAFWIQSILFQDDYPKVEINERLRKELGTFSVEELQGKLEKLDPKRFRSIDTDNSRRLVRSIEIAEALGSVPQMNFIPNCRFKTVLIYFDLDRDVLREKIRVNVESRYGAGLVQEARDVYENIEHKRFIELGLAYKHMGDFWAGAITERELRDKTVTEETRYAKRQKTFFKKILTRVFCKKYVISSDEQRKQVVDLVVKRFI